MSILTAYSLWNNSLKMERYTLSTLDSLEYAATHSSIVNIGSFEYTPKDTKDACSYNGFASNVCDPNGWKLDSTYTKSVSGTAWDYQCGKAPDSMKADANGISSYVFGGVSAKCTASTVQCACFPGYSGASCEKVPVVKPTLRGWCTPPAYSSNGYTNVSWWSIDKLPDRFVAKASVESQRSSSFCNNHGACTVTTKDSSLKVAEYAFCSCDEGFYGPNCEFKDEGSHGSYYNYAITKEDANTCNVGAVPSINDNFFTTKFPTMRCSKHGFGIALPAFPDGRLNHSNAFRVQTSSTCFCEPAFDGEECMGGAPISGGNGWIHAATSAILLFLIVYVYRDRRRMIKSYNLEIVSAKDYSVFVNYLPMVHTNEMIDVTKHFQQWGEVYTIAPALQDSVVTGYQREKNQLLMWQRIFREYEMFARKMDIWNRAYKDAKASFDTALIAQLEKEKPGPQSADASEDEKSLPDMSALVGSPKPLSLFDWITAYANANPIAPYVFATREFLYRYRLFLDDAIKKESTDPEVSRFARAFVTFKTMESRNKCIAAYSEMREGMFGKLPDYDPKILFKGKHWISVEPAVSPEEVNWYALSTGPRVRAFRLIMSYVLLIAIVFGLFQLVLVINASQATGIIGVLISLALTVVNMIVAYTWLYFVESEMQQWVGKKMRSLYIKVIITQIFVTILAGTIGVYGFPTNLKNGYIQEWYANAGGFVFRQVLIEIIVPPLMDVCDLMMYVNKFFVYISPSVKERLVFSRPNPTNLAVRCASLMRTMIMVCAFNSGVPALTPLFAAGLIIRYASDKYCYTEQFAVTKYGPELARALEVTLMFATAVQVITGWAVFNLGWDNNVINTAVFYLGVIGILWASLGYVSYRWYRGLDCCFGSGPICPCSGWLCCFNQYLLFPFHAVHKLFMTLVFGFDFFSEKSKDDSSEESAERKEAILIRTGGMPYGRAIEVLGLRKTPYCFFERGQVFPEFDDGTPEEERYTAREVKDQLLKNGGREVNKNNLLIYSESPLVQAQRAQKVKESGANKV